MNDQPRILAEIVDYPGLMVALRARFAERRIAVSAELTHEVAGLPARYLSKLLAPTPMKRLGMVSLGPVLGVAIVKENPEG